MEIVAFATYLRTNMPTYRVCEEWIVGNATKLELDRVAAYNARRIDARPEKAAVDRAEVGLDAPDLLWSYMLNDLGDWQTLHQLATA